ITPDEPVLSTEEPDNSLSIGDEHLDIILTTKSDEFIKSGVEDLIPIPRESDFFLEVDAFLAVEDEPTSSQFLKSYLDSEGDMLLFEAFLTVCDPEEEIRLIEKFLYDNSSPRPPEEFNSENYDTIIKSLFPSSIPVEDSNSLMKEIDLSLTPDDSMSPGIENDDYDSEGDILFLEELLSNDSFLLPENKSFHFDVSSSPRPSAKRPDDDEIKPDTGILTIKVVGDIYEHYVLMPRLLSTQPTLASNKEKSHHLLSHRGFKAFQLSSKSPMMIYGGNIPILDVPFIHFYPS
nr:hypothetical protein [Tanacetum cinerariifolium]